MHHRVRLGFRIDVYYRCGVDAMTHAKSAKQFEIRTAREMMMFNGREYRKAKSELNAYTTPVCKSVSFWMFNKTRHNYLKSMAALRSALKVKA